MVRLLGFSLLLLKLSWWVLFTPAQCFSDEVTALSAFKRAIYEDPYSILSDWNAQDGDPCGWFGVGCSDPDNHVVSLKLSNSSLKGFLSPAIGSLAYLQELFLDNNLFYGSIPKEISTLTSLQVLDLSNNEFSGPIPSELGNLVSISKIFLHANMLTGAIPDELGKLVSLVQLRLDINKLTGVIPGNNDSNLNSSDNNNIRIGLCKLTQLGNANFSYNYFEGEIPSCLRWLPRSNFEGNCLHDANAKLQRTAKQCTMGPDGLKGATKGSQEGHKHNKFQQPWWLLCLEIITGIIIIIFIIICIITCTRRYKTTRNIRIPWKKRSSSLKDHPVISINETLLENVPRISRQELEEACEDFSNIIGSSSDTVIYKGTMKGGPEIAVVSLCVSRNYWTTSYLEHYFKKEVSDLARLNHENLAKLIGYCKEYDPFSRMLVFEYASNGTLHEHLHDADGCQFTWQRRMRIALGIARGLRYLHTEVQPPFALTDLASTSVYLTEDFSPKLVDFERWKSLSAKPGIDSASVFDGGSFDSFNNYMDSQERRTMYIQANTFSFGVILLELISGRPPFSKETGYLADWAIKYLENPQENSNLLDPELKNVKKESLSVVCNVVSLCIEHDQTKRPSMQKITAMLEEGIDTSTAAVLKDSNLAWADLEIS
ncbi:Protein kinase family protein [Rhynchospora pubera]|uniref:Protein kinase family protein n=1 Tax=Rhynchospora pubera TaxID=906938 RepID=A0AAV8H5R3_9POAL|nr:Protein kinase family protein [Rhynchospora pubera]